MFGLGMQERLIIRVIALLLLGGKKLPAIAGGMGKAARELNRATTASESPESPCYPFPRLPSRTRPLLMWRT
jgi:sec-independent protein translocase protein TatA